MINTKSPPVKQLRVEVGDVLHGDVTEKDPEYLPLCVKREPNDLLCVLLKTDRERVLRDICYSDPLAWHCIQRDAWHQWFLQTVRIHAQCMHPYRNQQAKTKLKPMHQHDKCTPLLQGGTPKYVVERRSNMRITLPHRMLEKHSMKIGSLGMAHAAQRPIDSSIAHRYRAQKSFPQAL